MRERISTGDVATSSPSTRIRPFAGTTKPSSDLIIVLLPAPFGPSSPTAPRTNVVETSLSARFDLPYSTVTFSSETTASVSDMVSRYTDRQNEKVHATACLEGRARQLARA